MNYQILRTDHASDQLMEIVRYAAELSQSYEVAIGLLDKIEYAISTLAAAPHSGSYPRYPHLRRQGFRVLIAERYLVFYKAHDPARTVTIYHIVDSRTNNPQRLLP